MKVLLMGGSRFMGPAVVEAALAAGHDLTLFNRGTRPSPSPDARQLTGDRDEPETLRQLAGHGFDAVIDLSAYSGRQTELLLDALPEVPLFVHCSTGAVYEPQHVLPWREDTPFGPWSLWGAYAEQKLLCERVLAARRPAPMRTAVVRLPFVLGPRNYAPREEFVLNRILDGETVLLPGDGAAVFQVISTAQVGRLMGSLLEAPLPGGLSAYNAAARELVSLAGFVAVCAEVAGRPAKVRTVGNGPTGDDREAFDPLDCVFPFPNANYILDTRAIEELGSAPPEAPISAMVEDALRALEEDPERRRWSRTDAESRHL